METLLPCGTAQWAQLVLCALLPVSLVDTALLLRAPRCIGWRVDAAPQHFYGELKFLEEDLARAAPGEPPLLRPFVRRPDHQDHQVAAMKLPDRWDALREHWQQARERLRP